MRTGHHSTSSFLSAQVKAKGNTNRFCEEQLKIIPYLVTVIFKVPSFVNLKLYQRPRTPSLTEIPLTCKGLPLKSVFGIQTEVLVYNSSLATLQPTIRHTYGSCMFD